MREAPPQVPTPRYHRVQVVVERWIREGHYRPGERIPTEAELCRSFRVSRITVRRALDEIARRGWLSREPGRGTFVAPGARIQPVTVNWSDVIDGAVEFAQSTESRDVRTTVVRADATTAAVLALADGARVERVRHVCLQRGAVIGLITSWVPQEIARRFPASDKAKWHILTLMQRSGIRVGDSQQRIGAVGASLAAARALDVPVGAPLVRIERCVLDEAGRGLQRMQALYRADRYEYRLSLTRSNSVA